MDAKLYSDKEEEEIRGILLKMSHFIEESDRMEKEGKEGKKEERKRGSETGV